MSILTDGFKTLFAGSSLTIIGTTLKVISVTPPQLMGGGPNDTTTMHNTSLRTKQPKKLKTMGQMKATVAYDPACYTTLMAQMQVNQLITITFPTGQTEAFWGWLDDFTPGELSEGNRPTATITVECSNQDNSGNEVSPVAG